MCVIKRPKHHNLNTVSNTEKETESESNNTNHNNNSNNTLENQNKTNVVGVEKMEFRE